MFVPSPYRSTPGISEIGSAVQRSVHYLNITTIAEAYSLLHSFNGSSSTIVGRRQRDMMGKGVIGYRRFRNTNYLNESVWLRPFGESFVIGWNGSSGSSAQYSVVNVTGVKTGSTGHIPGCGQPWIYFNWDLSHSGHPVGLANKSAVLNLRNRVENEAKLKAMDMKMDLSESISGLPQTARMLAQRVEQVSRAIRSLRMGRFLEAARHLGINRRPTARTASQAWLELQYGWKPLVADIQSLMELAKSQLRAPEQFVVTRRGRVNLTLPDVVALNSAAFGAREKSGSAFGYAECKLRFRVSDPAFAYLTSLTLTNPAYLLWVGIPFSFVCDWFLPVADFLLGLTSTIGLTFTGGYTSLKTTSKWTASCVRWTPAVTSTSRVIAREGRVGFDMMSNRLRRYALSNFPISRLYYRFPFSSNSRIASAIALVLANSSRGGR